jgi:hypothetical protein
MSAENSYALFVFLKLDIKDDIDEPAFSFTLHTEVKTIKLGLMQIYMQLQNVSLSFFRGEGYNAFISISLKVQVQE